MGEYKFLDTMTIPDAACNPLRDLLGDVLTRLAALETKAGVTPAAASSSSTTAKTADFAPTKPAPVRALSIRSCT
jgi:hypothetical protein